MQALRTSSTAHIVRFTWRSGFPSFATRRVFNVLTTDTDTDSKVAVVDTDKDFKELVGGEFSETLMP